MKILKVNGYWENDDGVRERMYRLMTPKKFIDFCTNFANCTDHHDGNDWFSVKVKEVMEGESK